MKIGIKRWFVLSLCAAFLSVQAELLVVKKNADGFFAPMTEEDTKKDGKVINKILLRYQWPMCLASLRQGETRKALQQEQGAFLTAGVPYAEEKFIEQKIQQALGTDYSVIFVPTALYELFVLANIVTHFKEKNPLQNAVELTYEGEDEQMMTGGSMYDGGIDLREILDRTDRPDSIRKEINGRYSEANKFFFEGTISAVSYINMLFANMLFAFDPALARHEEALLLSNAIKNKSSELCLQLIKDFSSAVKSRSSDSDFIYGKGYFMPQLAEHLSYEPKNHIIANIVTLEYEAREINKAVLIRATEFESLQVGIGLRPAGKVLAGSTLLQPNIGTTDREYSLEKSYKKRENEAYSISFGDSLFAGAVRAYKGGCAYSYLAQNSNKGRPVFGYALFINKKRYVEHQEQNLFFIPPLSCLASLIQTGQFFHPRGKAATALKKGRQSVAGVTTFFWMSDPTGVLLITRDPLHHAELFSKYLAENGRIIQTGDMSNLTDEEKKFATAIMQNQQEAAQFYKNVRLITPLLTKNRIHGVTQKYKEINKREKRFKSGLLGKPAIARSPEVQDVQVATVWSQFAQDKEVRHAQKLDLFMKDCARLAYENKFIPSHVKNDKTVRIATYNVHMWENPQRESNYDKILKVIKVINADILVLQEVKLFDTAKINADFAQMGYQPGVFQRTWGNSQFGNMLFSKYPYARQPIMQHYKVDEWRDEKRGFMHATIMLPYNQKIFVYGTHLDVWDNTEKHRLAEIKELLKHTEHKSKHANVVLAGDFNAVRQKDYEYSIGDKKVWDLLVAEDIRRTGMPTPTDALNLVEHYGFVDSFTRGGLAGPKFTVWPGKVVDFLYLNKGWALPVVGSYVYYDAASDHIPVIMDVKIDIQQQEEEKHAAELEEVD